MTGSGVGDTTATGPTADEIWPLPFIRWTDLRTHPSRHLIAALL